MEYLRNNIFWSQLQFCSKFMNNFLCNFYSKIVISDFLCEIIPNVDKMANIPAPASVSISIFGSTSVLQSTDSRLDLETFKAIVIKIEQTIIPTIPICK